MNWLPTVFYSRTDLVGGNDDDKHIATELLEGIGCDYDTFACRVTNCSFVKGFYRTVYYPARTLSQ